jgi:hypothetical protein
MTIPKEINWETIDGMLIAGCNGTQCAAAIGIHPETLYNRCKDERGMGFSDYSQAKRAHGDGLLHAAQFQKAYKDKNPTMLIWLGKQRLNQKENDQLTDAETSRIAKQLSDAVKAETTITE